MSKSSFVPPPMRLDGSNSSTSSPRDVHEDGTDGGNSRDNETSTVGFSLLDAARFAGTQPQQPLMPLYLGDNLAYHQHDYQQDLSALSSRQRLLHILDEALDLVDECLAEEEEETEDDNVSAASSGSDSSDKAPRFHNSRQDEHQRPSQ